jgi:tetratricopeptide (TPR) repeat protein
MVKKLFQRSCLRLNGILGVLALVFYGCASGPEPKPDQTLQPSQEETQPTEEEITPLSDQPDLSGDGDDKPGDTGSQQETSSMAALDDDIGQLLTRAADISRSDPIQAKNLIANATRRNPNCFQCFYNSAVLSESQGRISEAENNYLKALKINPVHVESVANLSNLYIRQQREKKALSVVSNAVRAAPRDLNLRNQLVSVLLALDKFDQAAKQAKGVLAVDERNVPAMISLAQVYYQEGKYELAERILYKAKSNDDSNAIIFNRLGFVSLKMDNTTSAISAFKKAIELNPNQPEALNNLGVLYTRAHDFEGAVEHLRKAIALEPFFFEAYLNLGNALRGGKQFTEAEQAYRKANELKSKEARPILNLALLYLDDNIPGYEKSARYSLAIKHFNKFKSIGGRHQKLEEYIEEATKKHERAVKSELRKKKREEKKRQREEEKRRKEEEEKKKAEAEAAAAAAKVEEAASPPSGGKLGGGKEDENIPQTPAKDNKVGDGEK